MIELSTKNNITSLIVECLWFKSQLSLLGLDFEKAKHLLTEALNLAENNGMNRLSLKIMKAKEKLVEQILELEDPEKITVTMSKRMDILKIEEGFKKIVNSPAYQFKQNI